MSNAALLSARSRSVPSNLSVAHSSEGGLCVSSGRGCTLLSSDGRAFLDATNNVAHVGHANERVNSKVQQQQDKVNTNTRYLNLDLTAYTQRLLSTFPAPLSSGRCFLTASGSEANDLALRLCRAHAHARRRRLQQQRQQRGEQTGAAAAAAGSGPHMDMFVCLAHGYHGATNSVIDISPYKYRSRGGRGRQAHVIEVAVPENVRDEVQLAGAIHQLQHSVDEALTQGHSVCGVFAESVLSCAGQVFLPPSFLQRVFSIVRAAGGLCVSDEVQTGFGRLGTMWGFSTLDVLPDIVTLGKGIANGYPVGGAVCTEAVAQAFEGMEYFNSNAGTNTALAAAQAVLDCIEEQNLIAHAAAVGQTFLRLLRELAPAYPIVHDVRGRGLFLGVEIRTDLPPSTRLPTPSAAAPATVTTSPRTPSVHLRRLPTLALPVCCRLSSAAPSASASPAASAAASSSQCSLVSGDVCGWLSAALFHCAPVGILAGTDGPLHNVIKIKPPMVFSERDAQYFVDGLRAALEQLYALHPCLTRPANGKGSEEAEIVTQARAKL